jgi:hypothetical protein
MQPMKNFECRIDKQITSSSLDPELQHLKIPCISGGDGLLKDVPAAKISNSSR